MQIKTKLFLALILIMASIISCAGEKEKEITVDLTVPDTSWSIIIDEVKKVNDELWVVSTVSQNKDMMGAQVISNIQASVNVKAPDLPLKIFVIGKSWNWENDEPYVFIKDIKQIEKDLESGKLLYKSAGPD